MYTLAKIDLLDSYPLADVFDDEKYSIEIKSEQPEFLLDHAIVLFRKNNPKYHSYEDWINSAENGGYEFELLKGGNAPIFRASMVLLSPLIECVLFLAKLYHGGQVRKADGHPYLEHPLEVGWILHKAGFSPEIIAAGYAHDLLEDTPCPEAQIEHFCNSEILRIVKACSNDPALSESKDWEAKKKKYIESVRRGGDKAIVVSIADKISNLHSFFDQYEIEGESLWGKFNRGWEKKLWFEKEVFKMASQEWNHPLLKTYESLLLKLENLHS